MTYLPANLERRLRVSLDRQQQLLRSSLILNPVENIPFEADLAVVAGPLHGLYNSDKVRNRTQRENTPLQFAGRDAIAQDSRDIYAAWAQALGAEDVTLRVLSGLHAHIVLFMSLAQPGQTALILPVEAGGHMSGKAIVERLGLTVVEMAVNEPDMCIDMAATLERCDASPPDIIFVDRSEGLVVEDFHPLTTLTGPTTIFDASQYLTNIICGDHPNPFQEGFDLLVASIHKNFPGPQKALLATCRDDQRWQAILRGVSTYVSNMHSASTYAAALTLARSEWLAAYSKRMLTVAVMLEDALLSHGVPVVQRQRDQPPTHHVWIREPSRECAFATYEALESCLILTNFRKLPYSIGYGLRLGTSAAVRIGLVEEDVPFLAGLIAEVRRSGATPKVRSKALLFNESIWARCSD